MTEYSKNYCPQMPLGYFSKKVDSSYLILHPEKPCWLLVNEFGFECISLFDGKNSIAACSEIIASRYGADFATVSKDIRQFIGSLKKAGILDEDPSVGKLGKSISFKGVFLHVTDACNLQCKHCYASVYRRKHDALPDRDFIRFLENFYSSGGNSLVLSGGEPLMHKSIKKYFELNPAATIRLLTNGVLLSDEFASFLEGRNVFIQVSIDGSEARIHDSIRGKGTFDAALKGIETLKRHGLIQKTNLCSTIMQQNIQDLPNIIKLAKAVGIPHVRFLPLRNRGEASKNWDALHNEVTAEQYKHFYRYVFDEGSQEYPGMNISSGLSGFSLRLKELRVGNQGCSIGRNLVIDVNGDIYPCVLFMDQQYKLGNIRTTTLDALQQSSVLHELVDAIYERKNRIASCRSCLWKHFCGGACMGEVHERYGAIWRTDEFCDIRKSLCEKSIIKMIKGVNDHYAHREDMECF